MRIEIRLDSDRVARGGDVAGRVVVLEGGEARSLTLTVGCYERSPSFVVPVTTSTSLLREGDLATGSEIAFRHALPPAALPSVRGAHGELYWEIEAAADAPGLDARDRRRFEVASAPREA